MMRFLIILLALGLAFGAEAKSRNVTFVYEVKSNPPYILGEGLSTDWKKPGIVLEVLKLMGEKLNITLTFRRMPWARGLDEVGSNMADGIFLSSFKEERLKIGKYPMKDGKPDSSRQVMNQSYYLYKKRDSSLQWDGSKFKNLNGPVGAVIEYAIIGDLKNMGIIVDETTSQLNNLKKLAAGRIAAIADIETMTDFQIDLYPEEFKDIVKIYPPIRDKPYYLMLSHKFVNENPQLSEAIWDTIKEIRKTGQFNRIAKKYLHVVGPASVKHEK